MIPYSEQIVFFVETKNDSMSENDGSDSRDQVTFFVSTRAVLPTSSVLSVWIGSDQGYFHL